jgi:hypothetical protein
VVPASERIRASVCARQPVIPPSLFGHLEAHQATRAAVLVAEARHHFVFATSIATTSVFAAGSCDASIAAVTLSIETDWYGAFFVIGMTFFISMFAASTEASPAFYKPVSPSITILAECGQGEGIAGPRE